MADKKKGTKVDVREVFHEPWAHERLVATVNGLRQRSTDLYGKLLDSVSLDDREKAVRFRILDEMPDARDFSRDHPRMFSLVTSEKLVASQPLQEQLELMLATKQRLGREGGARTKYAHKQFIQTVMAVNTKPSSAAPAAPLGARPDPPR